MFNVLKKTLRSEFGRVKYEEYAQSIKQNIREAKTDNSEIFNDLYEILQQKNEKSLEEMQERLNTSLLDAFQVSKNYLWAFVAYLAAFVIICSYVIQLYAIPLLFIISGAFLVKTYESKGKKISYTEEKFKKLIYALLEKNACVIRSVSDINDNIVSACIILEDDNRCYNQFGSQMKGSDKDE